MDNPFANLQLANPGEAYQRAFDRSAEQTREREARRAAAQAVGGDTNALLKLWALDPRMGASVEDAIHQRSERQRGTEYRNALSDYVAGQKPNALMPPAYRAPGYPSAASVGPGSDAAARAMRADPAAFLTFQGKQLQVNESQLKTLKTIHDFGMQLLGGVHDQASYDAAKARAAALYQQHGVPMPELPPQYSPEIVRDLQMQGMDTEHQLQAIARENRLDWDIQDDIADNTRADANADSMQSYRQGQLGVARDRVNATRRGQDMADKRASASGKGGQGVAILNGQRIVVKGGKWVYEASGKPVE